MARSVAERWVQGNAQGEYRFTIFGLGTPNDVRKFASVLRTWRDGKLKLASMEPISDLGVREGGDILEVWSTNRDAMKKLANWAEGRGLDTSFIWE